MFTNSVEFDDHKFVMSYRDDGVLLEAHLVKPNGSMEKVTLGFGSNVYVGKSTIDTRVTNSKLIYQLRAALELDKSSDSRQYDAGYDLGYDDGYTKATEDYKNAYESELKLRYDNGFRDGVEKAAQVVARVPYDPKDKRDTITEKKYG